MLTAYENQPVVQSHPYAWVTGVQNVNTGGVTPLYGTPSPYPTLLHYRARPMYAVDYMAPPVVQLDQTVGPNLDRIYGTLWDMMMRRPQPRASSGSTSSSGNTNSATQQEPAQAPAASPNITLDGVLLGRVQQAIADAMRNSTPVATAGPVIPAVSTSAADTTGDVSVPWYGGNDPLMAAMTGSQTSGGFTISPEARAAYADIQAKQAERAARLRPYAEILMSPESSAESKADAFYKLFNGENISTDRTDTSARNAAQASLPSTGSIPLNMTPVTTQAPLPSTGSIPLNMTPVTTQAPLPSTGSIPLNMTPVTTQAPLPSTGSIPLNMTPVTTQASLPSTGSIPLNMTPVVSLPTTGSIPLQMEDTTNNRVAALQAAVRNMRNQLEEVRGNVASRAAAQSVASDAQSFLDLLVNDPLGLYYMLQGTKEQ